MRIGKYEFLSEKDALDKIKKLGIFTDEDGIDYPTHKHNIIHLGHIIIKDGSYDDEGNEIKAPLYSDMYHLDVLWDSLIEHPYGWKSFAIEPTDNKGVHSFYGIDFKDNKAQRNGK
jgi:hypothetical protein